jgi:hypothetical protein
MEFIDFAGITAFVVELALNVKALMSALTTRRGGNIVSFAAHEQVAVPCKELSRLFPDLVKLLVHESIWPLQSLEVLTDQKAIAGVIALMEVNPSRKIRSRNG